ncbi:MAG: pyrimidine 5'-nucleotidase [Anaerolineae bacterium]|jgi:pyrimidine 5'-nucleotidase|nr:pyrimidine 5'-nucleotidase [Anaerolineae bacterium]MCZ7554390.1 pyrimidine 5'-nucleotidase [Anaerolineales bacterium]
MPITTLFFDLDDTLYPNGNGLWQAIRSRMSAYMAERLGLPVDVIPKLREHYFKTYGTTLRGLQKHHQVDADDYLAYVHDLPLEEYLQPQPELRKFLRELPQRRFIFTNADSGHARRVLEALDIQGCFDGIIDVREIGFACKPELEAYQRALALAGDPAPQDCAMLDDSTENLATAKRLGMTTILIRRNHADQRQADYVVSSILDLRQIFPQLWEDINFFV